MDVQLQELIDKIKKDGVASAEQEANAIKENAKKEAESIIAEAKAKADSIIKDAQSETARLEKASVDAIKQSSRNLLIAFRDGITAELSAIVQAETKTAYSKALLEKLIPETVKAWASKSDVSDISVLLSENDLSELKSGLTSALKSEIEKGLEIKPDKTLAGGFRIGMNNGASFYDYSAESVAELFSAYLNPKLAEIMKEAAKE
ncbi:MAG: DivIVA domain-containing protein [Treponema sp.]|nr:DivIVA domain-containing protein [Candidatus Treponema merdequi]